ncbi:MAG: PhzF family phenazine biosynthesis protein [Devosia sp.]
MKLDYVILDVFTTERLQGNPLAVVFKADHLGDSRMQAIAAEFNLSETAFITDAKSERHTAALRIFTPKAELPFAGHPTVGSAVALAIQTRATAIRFEEQIGVVTCVLDQMDKRSGFARFALPKLPSEAGSPPDTSALAIALGIDAEDIGCGPYQPAVMSAGVPFYIVPVRTAGVLARMQPQRTNWRETFPIGMGKVYAFTETPGEPGNDLAARMFAPLAGIAEDPATGSAAASLVGLLARQALEGQSSYRIRQGHEMGRPSLIHVQLRKEGDALTHASIGGHAVVVGRGVLDLDV